MEQLASLEMINLKFNKLDGQKEKLREIIFQTHFDDSLFQILVKSFLRRRMVQMVYWEFHIPKIILCFIEFLLSKLLRRACKQVAFKDIAIRGKSTPSKNF